MFSYFVGGEHQAKFMTARHDTAFGLGSAIEETVRDDVLVVMMATSWNSCTTIHAIEEELLVPYREMRRFDYPAIIAGHEQQGTMTAFVRALSPATELRFDRIRDLLKKDGALRSCIFGETFIEAANAGDIRRLARNAMKKDPYSFVDKLEEN
jgi:aminoglycoside 3-N-acetyltransferase